MTDRPALPKPTASELEMLRLLWQLGPATARQVHQAAATGRPSLIKELIHKAFSGSGKELVLAALRGHVTQKEREEIQSILDREK